MDVICWINFCFIVSTLTRTTAWGGLMFNDSVYVDVCLQQPSLSYCQQPDMSKTCNMSDPCSKLEDFFIANLYDGVCYAIFDQTDAWKPYYDKCTGWAGRFPKETHGAAAVFANDNMYAEILNNLALSADKAKWQFDNGTWYNATRAVNRLVWVGAKATAGGNILADYCWMSGRDHQGSPVSAARTLVNIPQQNPASVKDPLCLAIDFNQPSLFYGLPCESNDLLMICEFGCKTDSFAICENSESPPSVAQCGNKNACPFGNGKIKINGSAPKCNTYASCEASWLWKNTTIGTVRSNINGMCYAVFDAQQPWNDTYDICNQNIGLFYPSMDFGRIAVFPNEYVYSETIGNLNRTNASKLWIGAQAQNTGLNVSDYCWKDGTGKTGSQVTNKSSDIYNVKSDVSDTPPFCLVTNIKDGKFYRASCNQYSMPAICEFGCTNWKPYMNCDTNGRSGCPGGACWKDIPTTTFFTSTTTSGSTQSAEKSMTTSLQSSLSTSISTQTSFSIFSATTSAMLTSTRLSMSTSPTATSAMLTSTRLSMSTSPTATSGTPLPSVLTSTATLQSSEITSSASTLITHSTTSNTDTEMTTTSSEMSIKTKMTSSLRTIATTNSLASDQTTISSNSITTSTANSPTLGSVSSDSSRPTETPTASTVVTSFQLLTSSHVATLDATKETSPTVTVGAESTKSNMAFTTQSEVASTEKIITQATPEMASIATPATSFESTKATPATEWKSNAEQTTTQQKSTSANLLSYTSMFSTSSFDESSSSQLSQKSTLYVVTSGNNEITSTLKTHVANQSPSSQPTATVAKVQEIFSKETSSATEAYFAIKTQSTTLAQSTATSLGISEHPFTAANALVSTTQPTITLSASVSATDFITSKTPTIGISENKQSATSSITSELLSPSYPPSSLPSIKAASTSESTVAAITLISTSAAKTASTSSNLPTSTSSELTSSAAHASTVADLTSQPPIVLEATTTTAKIINRQHTGGNISTRRHASQSSEPVAISSTTGLVPTSSGSPSSKIMLSAIVEAPTNSIISEVQLMTQGSSTYKFQTLPQTGITTTETQKTLASSNEPKQTAPTTRITELMKTSLVAETTQTNAVVLTPSASNLEIVSASGSITGKDSTATTSKRRHVLETSFNIPEIAATSNAVGIHRKTIATLAATSEAAQPAKSENPFTLVMAMQKQTDITFAPTIKTVTAAIQTNAEITTKNSFVSAKEVLEITSLDQKDLFDGLSTTITLPSETLDSEITKSPDSIVITDFKITPLKRRPPVGTIKTANDQNANEGLSLPTSAQYEQKATDTSLDLSAQMPLTAKITVGFSKSAQQIELTEAEPKETEKVPAKPTIAAQKSVHISERQISNTYDVSLTTIDTLANIAADDNGAENIQTVGSATVPRNPEENKNAPSTAIRGYNQIFSNPFEPITLAQVIKVSEVMPRKIIRHPSPNAVSSERSQHSAHVTVTAKNDFATDTAEIFKITKRNTANPGGIFLATTSVQSTNAIDFTLSTNQVPNNIMPTPQQQEQNINEDTEPESELTQYSAPSAPQNNRSPPKSIKSAHTSENVPIVSISTNEAKARSDNFGLTPVLLSSNDNGKLTPTLPSDITVHVGNGQSEKNNGQIGVTSRKAIITDNTSVTEKAITDITEMNTVGKTNDLTEPMQKQTPVQTVTDSKLSHQSITLPDDFASKNLHPASKDKEEKSNLYTPNANSKTDFANPKISLSSKSMQPASSPNPMPGDNAAIDRCQTLDWGSWSSCGVTCGFSARIRSRIVSTDNSSLNCQSQPETCILPKCTPMSPTEQIVSSIFMDIGCIWIMIGLGSAIIGFIIFRSRYYLQIIHLNEDVSLLAAHLLVLLFSVRNDSKWSQDTCKVAALGLQYFFSVTYTFQALEAFHIYTVLTNVVMSDNHIIGLGLAMTLGWGAPAVITGITCATSYDSMMSHYACWINVDNSVFLATFVPVVAIAWLTVIFLEATGHLNSFCKSTSINSCMVARGGLAFVFTAQFASWFMASSATYYQHISLFTIVFGINIALGVFIFMYHLFSNQKARLAAINLHRRIRGKPLIAPNTIHH